MAVRLAARIHEPYAPGRSPAVPCCDHCIAAGEAGLQFIILTDHGQPTIRITPYRRSAEDRFRALRGTVRRYDDPEAPVEVPWDAES